MQILDGKKAAQAIKDELRIDVAYLVAEGKKIPHLAAILVGTNGASETYVAAKVKACEEVGFKSTLIRFEEEISEGKLLDKIAELNSDPDISSDPRMPTSPLRRARMESQLRQPVRRSFSAAC